MSGMCSLRLLDRDLLHGVGLRPRPVMFRIEPTCPLATISL